VTSHSLDLSLDGRKALEGQAALDAYSRGHAIAMVLSAGGAVVLGKPWPTCAVALASFSFLFARGRRNWAAERRTVLPNLVTAGRALLIASAGIALHGAPGPLFAAVMVALLGLDGLDGWLARRANAVTAFGAHFDMETDAFFVLLVDLELFTRGRLGAWILTTGLLRYAYTLITALVPSPAGQVPRSRLGRNSFGCLVTGLCCAMASRSFAGTVAAAIGTALVAASFAVSFHWSYVRSNEET
jgi:phosphatidylglycerophosphate synthase